jgi:cob(I)alamin adenosyltransferase
MAEGCIYIYTGDGRGKSPAAIGRAVQAAVEGKRVVIIQFLKGKGLGDSDFLRRMEPEIKLFRFEKSDGNFVELPEEKKQEEIQNIRNGIGFAKKVLTTGECDLLILDEVLGLVEKDIITEDDAERIYYSGYQQRQRRHGQGAHASGIQRARLLWLRRQHRHYRRLRRGLY